ncbi:mucin-binding protein [Companilactobacillus hulinensis]|uniref:mucin-binding protein n=1 Tax=Companilactobacillus hulinensis TaxID=2486007 RepID=UPI000F78BA38|nr:hypothetical protein [Companilactobacillus hulinensis]
MKFSSKKTQTAPESKKFYKVGKYWVYANITALGLGLSLASTTKPVRAATDDGAPTTEVTSKEAIQEDTIPDANAVTDQSSSELNQTYTDTQTQIDTSNEYADKANARLAEIQSMLNDPNLKNDPQWKAKLQFTLSQYQNDASYFQDSAVGTKNIVDKYQAAINAAIAKEPNAVSSVTQDGEVKGTTIDDYNSLVANYQKQVDKELATVNANLDSYNQSTAVNSAQSSLQTAAGALNTGISKNLAVDELTALKSTYDAALTKYNQAVSDYNTAANTSLSPVDVSKNPTDDNFDKLVNYKNAKTAYDTADKAHTDLEAQAKIVNDNLSNWQTAVNNYNDKISQIQSSVNISSVSTADIDAKKDAINAAATAYQTAQDAYTVAQNSADVAQILATGDITGKAFETLSAATEEWKNAYQTYIQDVKDAASRDLITSNDLSNLKSAITDSQDTINPSIDALAISQTDYQTALTEYQNKLKLYDSNLSAGDSTSIDYSQVKSDIDEQFKTVGDSSEVINSQKKLQQRINQINNLIGAMNNSQEIWTTISGIAAKTGQWNILNNNLQTIGDNFLHAAYAYEDAIEGTHTAITNTEMTTPAGAKYLERNVNQEPKGENNFSYSDLVDTYTKKVNDYNLSTPEAAITIGDFTDSSTVSKNFNEFQSDLETFRTGFNDLANLLAENSPNEELNKIATDSLADPKKLSTNDTSVRNNEDEGGGTLYGYLFYGDSLSTFIDQALMSNKIPGTTVSSPFYIDSSLIEADPNGNSYYRPDAEEWSVFLDKLTVNLVQKRSIDGKDYQLTGLFVTREFDKNGLNFKPVVSFLTDYYVFTSPNPLSEFNSITKGISGNSNDNNTYRFYYTAIPDLAETVTDPDTGETTQVSKVAMPKAETIKSLTADSLTLESAVNNVENISAPILPVETTLGLYQSGISTVDNSFNTLDIPNAPKLNINQAVNTDVTITTPDGDKKFNITEMVDGKVTIDVPQITGYTTSSDKVTYTMNSDGSATPDTSVIYTANSEKATVNFVDGTATGSPVLSTVERNGDFKTTDNYNPQATIDDYIKQGYVLDTSDFPENGIVYDLDEDKTYTITLVHGTKTVDIDNPGTIGDPIDATNPDGPKYPAGTDFDSLTKIITRTIEYVDGTGNETSDPVQQTVTYNHTVTFDQVTGEITNSGEWTTDKNTFDTVESPTVTGYTPDEASTTESSTTADSSNSNVTVTYTANKETANVTYIDGTTGKKIKTDTLSGDFNTSDGYNPQSTIDSYLNNGYQLESSDFPEGGIIYDTDGTTKEYTITLTHKIITINENTSDIPSGVDLEPLNKTVTRTITYGYENGYTAQPSVVQTATFNRTAKVDLVDKTVDYDKWNSEDSTLTEVPTAEITGYEPDFDSISKIDVTNEFGDTTENVTYIGKTLDKVTVTIPTPEGDKTVELTNVKVGNSVEIPVPNIPGFTAEQVFGVVTPEETVTTGEITYTPKQQSATVIYTDENTGDELGRANLTGAFDSTDAYTTADIIQSLKDKHYVFVSDEYTPTNGEVFNKDGVTQEFRVVLKHDTKSEPEEKSVTRTINYLYENKVEAKSPVTQTALLSRTKTTDLVTGNITFDGWQPIDITSFDAVKTDEIKGYTPDSNEISSTEITGDSDDATEIVTYTGKVLDKVTVTIPTSNGDKVVEITGKKVGTEIEVDVPSITGYTPKKTTVTGVITPEGNVTTEKVEYSAKPQQAQITYQDETTGTDLESTEIPGYFNTPSDYSTSTLIDKYEKLGYKVTLDNFPTDGIIFTEYGIVPEFTVTLKHRTEDVTDKRAVTQTIHYQNNNGEKLRDDTINTINFERTGTKDLVTGETEYKDWISDNERFDEITAPVIDGHTATNGTIQAIPVSSESPDNEQTVIYTKNQTPVTPDNPDEPDNPTTPDTDTNSEDKDDQGSGDKDTGNITTDKDNNGSNENIDNTNTDNPEDPANNQKDENDNSTENTTDISNPGT